MERREEVDLNFRNQNYYYLPFSRLRSIDICPIVIFPKLWKEFTSPWKFTANKNFFKKELNTYLQDNLLDI